MQLSKEISTPFAMLIKIGCESVQIVSEAGKTLQRKFLMNLQILWTDIESIVRKNYGKLSYFELA